MMLGTFEEIKTLECLRRVLTIEDETGYQDSISTDKLECYLETLCNIPNASQIVTGWINELIDEYNNRYLELKEKSLYNLCLYKAFDYFLPFLATYEKLETLINMCSLVDDEDEDNKDSHLKFFEESVRNATNYAKRIHILDLVKNGRVDNGNEILYLLGFLNFRIQQYDMAITYLKPCTETYLEKISNDESISLYINSLIYLVESYEYRSDLDNALKQLLGVDGEHLKKLLNDISSRIDISRFILENYSNIDKGEESLQYIKEIYKCLCDSQKDLPASYKVFQLKGISKSLKSFVHITAHCLSEYAALCMDEVAKKQGEFTKEIRIYSLLQQVSRFLMDWLVGQDDSYVTCQATIRAENDACPEAINILIKRLKELEKTTDQNLSMKEKVEKAELQFYIFYFAEQELNINNNKNNLLDICAKYGTEFYRFVKESGDTNALFHYLVIQFKYLLKKAAQDILQLNNSSDYTELDKIYHQICICRKSPLPHVFRELIEESERLENAYLLLREYRYLFKKDTDFCNMKEFYNRLDLKRKIIPVNNIDDEKGISDSEDDEDADVEGINIIKELIDEIEAKKRILILAPVKTAPSCSLDYRPINQLTRLVDCKNESNDFETIHSDFQQVAAEHSKKKGIDKILQCDNIECVKWMIYYDSSISALFIYYNDLIDEMKGEMLRANLNENEKNHLNKLFRKLKNNFFHSHAFQVDCNQNEHKKIYESGGVCTTWVIRGSDVTCNDKLLEILIFSEFDFCSLSDSVKVNKDDYIMFSSDVHSVAKYKIVCFEELPKTKKIGICNYCRCVDVKGEEVNKENSCEIKYPQETHKCIFNGKSVDLQGLEINITKRINKLQLEEYGEVIELLEEVHREIRKCRDYSCQRKDSEYQCEWIKKCRDNGVDIPIKEG
ncbi:MAG: hypothetical protein NC429_09180 [Lachnospiraceae bacterium]|nr:hypothetical protein [Lachnospiraceae bacterium]